MSKTKPLPRKQCPTCCGCGTVPVSGVFAATMAEFGPGVEWTGAELGERLGVQATAMNQRLAMLERFGLLVSRVNGRRRPYRRA